MDTTRRTVLLGALGACTGMLALPGRAEPASEFETLFAEALKDPDSLERVRLLREQPQVNGIKAVAPRVKPSKRKVAPEALRLLVLFEVSGERRYTAKYQQPVWPGGESGATIGVGYDLGYSKAKWLEEDWCDYLDPAQLTRLTAACGKTGSSAKKLIPGLRDVAVPWSDAYQQFEQRLVPLYTASTLSAVPLAEKLSDKSLGALVSLVYNRGPSFGKPGNRYREMRAIKSALAAEDYGRIPDLIREMVRLWDRDKFAGLHLRRKMEAALFQEGLA
jgi:GH24 family phage-related lysozyme (muramidase)